MSDVRVRRRVRETRAWRFDGALDLPDWARGKVTWTDGRLLVSTPSGKVTARQGDWILLDPKGGVYPVVASVFDEAWEVVSDE